MGNTDYIIISKNHSENVNIEASHFPSKKEYHARLDEIKADSEVIFEIYGLSLDYDTFMGKMLKVNHRPFLQVFGQLEELVKNIPSRQEAQ